MPRAKNKYVNNAHFSSYEQAHCTRCPTTPQTQLYKYVLLSIPTNTTHPFSRSFPSNFLSIPLCVHTSFIILIYCPFNMHLAFMPLFYCLTLLCTSCNMEHPNGEILNKVPYMDMETLFPPYVHSEVDYE